MSLSKPALYHTVKDQHLYLPSAVPEAQLKVWLQTGTRVEEEEWTLMPLARVGEGGFSVFNLRKARMRKGVSWHSVHFHIGLVWRDPQSNEVSATYLGLLAVYTKLQYKDQAFQTLANLYDPNKVNHYTSTARSTRFDKETKAAIKATTFPSVSEIESLWNAAKLVEEPLAAVPEGEENQENKKDGQASPSKRPRVSPKEEAQSHAPDAELTSGQGTDDLTSSPGRSGSDDNITFDLLSLSPFHLGAIFDSQTPPRSPTAYPTAW